MHFGLLEVSTRYFWSLMVESPTSNGLGTGMTWSWTFSLVLGWYCVGTQVTRKCINRALLRATEQLQIPLYLVSEPRSTLDASVSIVQSVKAIGLNDGRALLSQRQPSETRNPLFGLLTSGDEDTPGPIYNYARIHLWQQIAVNILNA